MTYRILVAALLALMGLVSASTAQQGLFAPVIRVNDMVITQYELDQRARFLTLLRAPGNPAEQARQALIDDRLRSGAARAAGIEVGETEIVAGIEDFAGRANRSGEEFMAALSQAGVSEQTMRDFVRAGLVWRQYVQGRFGPRATVTDAEVDTALSLSTSQTEVRVLLSELILPLAPQVEAQNRALIDELSQNIRGQDAFADAARRFSAAPTAPRGGRLDWLPLGRIPPALRAQVLTLAPGEVSDPIDLGPGIGIFQLRALEENAAAEPETLALEYVSILIPNSSDAQSIAADYRDGYDTCDDLYKPAMDLPEGYFTREVLPAGEVPGDIALELARLDDNETSANLTRQDGAFTLFLRLCGRTVEAPLDEEGEAVDQRTQLRDRLFQQRLESYANAHLEELRADAIIVEQ